MTGPYSTYQVRVASSATPKYNESYLELPPSCRSNRRATTNQIVPHYLFLCSINGTQTPTHITFISNRTSQPRALPFHSPIIIYVMTVGAVRPVNSSSRASLMAMSASGLSTSLLGRPCKLAYVDG